VHARTSKSKFLGPHKKREKEEHIHVKVRCEEKIIKRCLYILGKRERASKYIYLQNNKKNR
jgi:hypothetical protein